MMGYFKGMIFGGCSLYMFNKTKYASKIINNNNKNIYLLSSSLLGGVIGMYITTRTTVRNNASMLAATTARYEDPIRQNYPNGGIEYGSQSPYNHTLIKNHNQVLNSIESGFERRKLAISKAKEERSKPKVPSRDSKGGLTY